MWAHQSGRNCARFGTACSLNGDEKCIHAAYMRQVRLCGGSTGLRVYVCSSDRVGFHTLISELHNLSVESSQNCSCHYSDVLDP